MSVKPKKKIQINIDAELAADVEDVLEQLGLTQTAMVTALYKRVAAQGEIPFSFKLTEEEKIARNLVKEVKKLPVRNIDSQEEFNEWLLEDEDE